MAICAECFLIIFLQTRLGNFVGKYNHTLVVAYGVFLLGVGMMLLTFSVNFSFIVFSFIVYTFGEMLFFSVAQLICYENTHKEKRGSIIGTYRMVFAFSRICGPVSGSYIYQYLGSNYLWGMCGMLGSVCLAGAVFFRRSLKKSFE